MTIELIDEGFLAIPTESATTDWSLTMPGGLQFGDFIVISLNEAVTSGPSFTAVTAGLELLVFDNDSGSQASSSVAIYYYRVPATPPASLEWTLPSAQRGSIAWAAFRGVRWFDPIDDWDYEAFAVTPNRTVFTAPSITTTVANAYVLTTFNTGSGSATVNPESPYVEIVQATERIGAIAVLGEVEAPGVVPSMDWTSSTSSRGSTTHIALAPAEYTPTISDSYTDTNGTVPDDHTPESGGTITGMGFALNESSPNTDATIQDGVLVAAGETNAGGPVWRYDADPGGDTYKVGLTVRFSDTVGQHRRHALFFGMTADGTTLANTSFYEVFMDNDSATGEILLVQHLANTASTILDTFNGAISGQLMQVVAYYDAGTGEISVELDGAEILSATGDITDRGRVAVGTSRGSSDHWVDNLFVEALVADDDILIAPDSAAHDQVADSPIVASGYEGVVLADEPIRLWMLDEETGPVVDTIAGEQGTVGAGVTLGGTSGALTNIPIFASFDGTQNGRIASNPACTAYPISFEAWVRTSQSGWGTVYCEADLTQQDRVLQMTVSDGPLGASIRADTAWDEVTGSTAINDGQWHHVVAVFEADGGSTDITLYVDGQQDGTGTLNAGFPAGLSGAAMGILDRSTSDTDNLTGDLAAVAVYDYALTPTEIQAHYEAGADAAISITPDSAVHDQVADSPTVTQVHQVAPDEATHDQAADSPAVTQVHQVAPDDAAHVQVADSPLVTEHLFVTPDEATHDQVADSPTVTQDHQVAPDDAAHVQTADSPSVTTGLLVTPDDAAHAQVADSPAVTQDHQVVPDDAAHDQAAESPLITEHLFVSPDEATHTQQAGSPVVDQSMVIEPDDAAHAQVADSPAVTQQIIVTPDSTFHGQTVDSPGVTNESVEPTQGSWYTLLGIRDEILRAREEENDRRRTTCPFDGYPLETGPDGRLHCPFDGIINV